MVPNTHIPKIMKPLPFAESLALPLNAITQKLAMLGQTGSGKTYAATKLAELMLEHGAQIIALDPVGVWYGLDVPASEGGKAFTIPVFGGLHGDMPLEPTGGALIARIIVEKRISAVVDVSQFIPAEQSRFAHDFINALFQLKKSKPSAVHLFVEECQEFIPQNIVGGSGGPDAKLLNVFTRLIKLGRNFGIGATLISQRPQEVNKKCLNQASAVFAFRMSGGHERKAMEEWTKEKGVSDNLGDVLPKLKTGSCRVWSPEWLKVADTFHVAPKITADVSSTPEFDGKARKGAKKLAPADMEMLCEQMAETIERAKADDPKELKAKIASLQIDLIQAKDDKFRLTPDPEAINKVYQEGYRVGQNSMLSHITSARKLLSTLAKLAEDHRPLLLEVQDVEKPLPKPKEIFEHPNPGTRYKVGVDMAAPVRPTNGAAMATDEKPGGGLRRMMIALAQRSPLSRAQVGVRAGLSAKSGSFGTYLGKGRSMGWIEGGGDALALTGAGINALGSYERLPAGRELYEYWLGKFGNSGKARILRVLFENYPKPLSRDKVGEIAKISSTSGSFGTYLGELRTLELVDGPGGALLASAEFFS